MLLFFWATFQLTERIFISRVTSHEIDRAHSWDLILMKDRPPPVCLCGHSVSLYVVWLFVPISTSRVSRCRLRVNAALNEVNGHISRPTSHIWSWKRRRSFSISSAISAPVISVRIIPCCLACSRFSFSIFVLTQRREQINTWMCFSFSHVLGFVCRLVTSTTLLEEPNCMLVTRFDPLFRTRQRTRWYYAGLQQQTLIIHLQLGLVVLPCFVKGLLYVLQKHRRASISKLQRSHHGNHVVCRVGSLPETQHMPHSAHDLFPGRTASDCSPSLYWNIRGSWPSYLPLASGATWRRCLFLQDLQCDLKTAKSWTPNSPISRVTPSYSHALRVR